MADIGLTVEFLDVEVVSESDLVLCCRVAGRDYWIAHDRLITGSSIAHFGDRGTIVVARQFAEDQGLLLDRPFPLA